MQKLLSSKILAVTFLLAFSFDVALAQGSNGENTAAPVKLALPLKDGSVRFAAIGDTGTGSAKQHELGEIMARYRASFPFEFVLMMGDNLYGSEKPSDYEKKFEMPYKKLLDDKVKFYASLGNHDLALQVHYEHFNMNGKEYYRFAKGDVAFYALNSNYMDQKQVAWLESELAKDTAKWKVCFFHHAPYSSAKAHGSDRQLREVVEPIFVKYGVDVVLAGHDHVYERVKPQKGIHYFVTGAGGKLRSGDIDRSSQLTAKADDRDLHFMLFEVTGDEMHFQTITRTGETIDAGIIPRRKGHIEPGENPAFAPPLELAEEALVLGDSIPPAGRLLRKRVWM